MATLNPTAGAYSAPYGTVVSGVRVSLLNNGSVISQQTIAAPTNSQPTTLTFPSVSAGTYTVTAQAVDASGAAIGPAATSSTVTVTVANPNVTVLIPASVTVTQS